MVFSTKQAEVITGLDKEASCTVATTPVTCQKKPIYRRFDGKCSNLKQPVAGGAGTALTRLEQAVSMKPIIYLGMVGDFN